VTSARGAPEAAPEPESEPGAAAAFRRQAAAARIAWFATGAAQTERDRPAPVAPLPPPADVEAVRGIGQVTIAWSPVPGAIGYLVHRSDAADGRFAAVDQLSGDVLAVPHGPYIDTTGPPDGDAWYAVSSVATIESAETAPLSAPARVEPGAADGAVRIAVDAAAVVGPVARPWRPIIGSEHLALLLRGAGPGGHDVGAELAEAFAIVQRELGARAVRAHAILHDSLGVYRDAADGPVLDFGRVDAVLDRLLATGLRPIVELSFMPRDLASDPGATVFAYEAIVSPPRDHERWAELVSGLVRHLVERYGRDEVRAWAFEVWNEPNLQLFWSAAESDYFRLYEATARAVRSVDPGLRVGGPATAAAGWIDDLLEQCRAGDVPLDFLSTHTYGAPPLDLRPIAARFGRPDLPLWWTEWGVSSGHGAPVNDTAWAAPLVARGMRSAAGRLEALAYWVASDHFVELGEAPSLFHGGFGLLTIGNLRKPRFWAIAMLERLGDEELACEIVGDGAASLVEAWPTRDREGRLAIAVWNGTLDRTKSGGASALDRTVGLRLAGLAAARYTLRHQRIDADHSNIVRTWEELGTPDWPDATGWQRLHAADRLELLEPPRSVRPDRGRLDLAFDLPMPAMSLIELLPE
jgi:xylan 1,4-beta-xylosidase